MVKSMTTVRVISNGADHNDSAHIVIGKNVVWSSFRKPLNADDIYTILNQIASLGDDFYLVQHRMTDDQFKEWRKYVL